MLYYFFRFLEEFDIPGSHLWSYISFRAMLTLILSLLISAWFGEKFVKWMKRRKIFETERDPSIDPFGVEKKGVPTMGGIIIIVSILVPVLLLCRIRNIYIILMVVTTLWLGFLGFLDDIVRDGGDRRRGIGVADDEIVGDGRPDRPQVDRNHILAFLVQDGVRDDTQVVCDHTNEIICTFANKYNKKNSNGRFGRNNLA